MLMLVDPALSAPTLTHAVELLHALGVLLGWSTEGSKEATQIAYTYS